VNHYFPVYPCKAALKQSVLYKALSGFDLLLYNISPKANQSDTLCNADTWWEKFDLLLKTKCSPLLFSFLT